MHWILDNNTFNEPGYDRLIDVLNRFKSPYSIHKVAPMVGALLPLDWEGEINEDTLDPVLKDLQGPVICMGPYSMRHQAQKYNWWPGVFDLEPFHFEIQREHWGEMMLNYDSVVTRFADAKIADRSFMRPIEDSKVFAGKVFTSEELEKWQHSILNLKEDDGSTMDADTLVQVCSVKQIYAEYRFWIVHGHIVTASMYKRGDRVIHSDVIDRHVYGFVGEVLKTQKGVRGITLTTANDGWMPHDAFVLDVAETPEGMRVVEINTLNSAGYYAANLTDLVLALESGFRTR